MNITELESQLKTIIDEKGFELKDTHFDRTVKNLPGHFTVVDDKEFLDWLRSEEVLEKYKDDSKRMYSSMKRAMSDAKTNLNSRWLMVFNDSKYDKVHQCFTHFQFIYTGRNEFDLYVYQRSADIAKLKDDLVFFAHQMKKFEKTVEQPVTKLVVVYGSLHYEVK